MAIISYGGSSIPILGTGHLRVWRRDFRCLLDCNLVDSKKVSLGRKACLGMNIIQYLDKDQLNRPQESYGEVYIHDVPASSPISTDQLIKSFPCVFADGVGALAGEYHIVLDESARPVQHPPRRVPVAIRECLRETLEDLEKHNASRTLTDKKVNYAHIEKELLVIVFACEKLCIHLWL